MASSCPPQKMNIHLIISAFDSAILAFISPRKLAMSSFVARDFSLSSITELVFSPTNDAMISADSFPILSDSALKSCMIDKLAIPFNLMIKDN